MLLELLKNIFIGIAVVTVFGLLCVWIGRVLENRYKDKNDKDA